MRECVCMCVYRLSPPPCRPARKGVGDELANSCLKPGGPAVAACSREENGYWAPRCAADGGGEWGGGWQWPRGAGRAGLRQSARGWGGLAAVPPSLAVARLDGRFPWLPRAPGSLAS